MPGFPVTKSILSAEHIGLFVQEKYPVQEPLQCRILKAGINDTYVLSGQKEKYVCRVYTLNWRSETEILEEIRLLHELNTAAVPVSVPLPDREGNYIQTLRAPEGNRFAVLFTHAEGEKKHSIPEAIHFRAGQLMARFHEVTINRQLNRITYTPELLLEEPLPQIAAFLPTETLEYKFLVTAQQSLFDLLKNADIKNIRTGIVHLDIWFDNFNITADDRITLFDFDFCGNGWLCLDIAYYILQLHNTEKYEPAAFQPKMDAFLKGYESVSPVSTEEKRLLPALGTSLYFFYLGVQCQRYDNWSNHFLNEDYLKRFINGLVKRYYCMYFPAPAAIND